MDGYSIEELPVMHICGRCRALVIRKFGIHPVVGNLPVTSLESRIVSEHCLDKFFEAK
jgi:hypothetical protein